MLRNSLNLKNSQNDSSSQEESKQKQNKNARNTRYKANSVNRVPAKEIITQVPQLSKQNNFPIYTPQRVSALTPTNRTNYFSSKLLPPKGKKFLNKKTLVLDLDETLVHSSFTPFDKSDIILKVDFEEDIYNIHVLVRPYVEKFIEEVSKLFEVVIFTASISKYASPLLDILDKDKKCVYRLFREHCTFINGVYIKDLKRLNRDLRNVIIVDNSPIAYSFNQENGLPILSWFNDKKDNELLKILPLLHYLSGVSDVREVIPSVVYDDNIDYEKVKQLSGNNEQNQLRKDKKQGKIIKTVKRKNLFCVNNNPKIELNLINNTNSNTNLLQKTFSHISPMSPQLTNQISNQELKQKMQLMKISSSIYNIAPIKVRDTNINNENNNIINQTKGKSFNFLESKEKSPFLSATSSNFGRKSISHQRKASPNLKISTSNRLNNPLSTSLQCSKTNYNLMSRSKSTGRFVDFCPISSSPKNQGRKIIKAPNNLNMNSNLILLYKNFAKSTRHKNGNGNNILELKSRKI